MQLGLGTTLVGSTLSDPEGIPGGTLTFGGDYLTFGGDYLTFNA